VSEKQVDLLCRDPENRVVSIEIAHSSGHEVHNALHCLRFAEVRKHVVVCTSNAVMKDVKKRFSRVPELHGNRGVEVVVLSRALSDGWIP
jgi:hypothetical protein